MSNPLSFPAKRQFGYSNDLFPIWFRNSVLHRRSLNLHFKSGAAKVIPQSDVEWIQMHAVSNSERGLVSGLSSE